MAALRVIDKLLFTSESFATQVALVLGRQLFLDFVGELVKCEFFEVYKVLLTRTTLEMLFKLCVLKQFVFIDKF